MNKSGLLLLSFLAWTQAHSFQVYDFKQNLVKSTKTETSLSRQGEIYGASSYFIPYYLPGGGALKISVASHYLNYNSSSVDTLDHWCSATYDLTLRVPSQDGVSYDAFSIGFSRKGSDDDDYNTPLYTLDEHEKKW